MVRSSVKGVSLEGSQRGSVLRQVIENHRMEGICMDLESQSHRWYAIRTRSRSEKIVRDQLAAQEIEEFLPLVKRISYWKDQQKVIEWPLFQGYCFARFCSGEKHVVLQTPGVVEIVGRGGSGYSPEPILEEDIRVLQHVMGHPRRYESHPYLEEGMPVSVMRGPFEGINGMLVRKGDRCRMVLSIPLICQSVAIHIDADDVTSIEKPSVVAYSIKDL